MYAFLFICPNSNDLVIEAKSRASAIEKYLKMTGMPEDFFKQHILVKNLGKVVDK